VSLKFVSREVYSSENMASIDQSKYNVFGFFNLMVLSGVFGMLNSNLTLQSSRINGLVDILDHPAKNSHTKAISNLKCLFDNHLADFNYIWQEAFLGHSLFRRSRSANLAKADRPIWPVPPILPVPILELGQFLGMASSEAHMMIDSKLMTPHLL
jgi:hypothetical protein